MLQPLVVGETYYVSYWVNLATEGSYWETRWACNNQGVLFTMEEHIWSGTVWSVPEFMSRNYAHVNNPEIVTDTANWTLVSGSFVADSAYQYVMLGNPFNDANTDTLHMIHQHATNLSYTLIDNVCVSLDPLGCPMVVVVEERDDEALMLYPNPAQHHVVLSGAVPGALFSIHDMLGRSVWQEVALGSRSEIDVRSWARGTYVLRAESGRMHKTFKFVLID